MKLIAVRFAIVASVLFVVDWVLAALTGARVLPKWVFPLANPPFGVIYTWWESHWNGTSYVFNGRYVGDDVAILVIPAVVLLQAVLYVAVYEVVRRRWARGAALS
jgi:hypothetical protein